jgi:hypothetical protein
MVIVQTVRATVRTPRSPGHLHDLNTLHAFHETRYVDTSKRLITARFQSQTRSHLYSFFTLIL